MNRAILGRAGEALAAFWLDCLKYQILEYNMRSPRGEIDLVCQEGHELAFVEVRLRSVGSLDTPAQSVTYAKQRRLYLAAASYLAKTASWRQQFRFDLIEIELTTTKIHVSLLSNFMAARGWW